MSTLSEFQELDYPKTITRFVIGAGVIALMFAFAVAFRDASPAEPAIRGVLADCASQVCLSPRQLVTASDAKALKRRLGNHALVVDIATAREGTAVGSDVRAPFVETEGLTGMTLRVDFADKVDDALRAAGMGHDEPVILLSSSVEHSVLAALLLQERGYTGVLVVRD